MSKRQARSSSYLSVLLLTSITCNVWRVVCAQTQAQAGRACVARMHGAAVSRDAAQRPRGHARLHLRGHPLRHSRARPRRHLQGLLLRAPAMGRRLQSHRGRAGYVSNVYRHFRTKQYLSIQTRNILRYAVQGHPNVAMFERAKSYDVIQKQSGLLSHYINYKER